MKNQELTKISNEADREVSNTLKQLKEDNPGAAEALSVLPFLLGSAGAASLFALSALGTAGLSAAGITSGLATAGAIVGGGMVAGIGVLAAPTRWSRYTWICNSTKKKTSEKTISIASSN